MRAGPTQEEIRRHNLGVLLRSIHLNGPASRSELTASLGLNRSTIGALTTDLVAAGIVREALPKGRSRAGRPSPVVRPESELVYVMAFNIEADRLTAARVGLGGVILDRLSTARRPGQLSPTELVEPLGSMASQMCANAPSRARHIGSGAAISRVVRHTDGQVELGAYGGDAHDPISEALLDALPVGPDGPRPMAVRNGADLAVLAEHTRGVAVGCDNVVYLNGDGGVGGGIIAAGRLVTGHGGYGGEVGHMVVNPNGQPCRCGSSGCWDTEVGEYALLRAAQRPIGTGQQGIEQLVEAARFGDVMAQSALRQVGDWLGFGVANLVNIFNPEMVIFGGTLREVYLAAAAQIRSRLNRNSLPACREHVRLRTCSLGENAALLGAAELAFERLLNDPLDGGSD